MKTPNRPDAEGSKNKDRLDRFRRVVSAHKKDCDIWWQKSRKIEKIYKSDTDAVRSRAKPVYNTLWSNVTTLLATAFSRLAYPICERRYRDKDPVGRLAAKILERGISFAISAQEHDLYHVINDCCRDYFLGGFGIAWVRYQPYFEQVVSEATQDGTQKGTPEERVTFEEVIVDYIHPQDFGWNSNARNWKEVRQIWKKLRFSKKKLKETFPETWELIPLDDYDENPYGDSYRMRGDDVEPKATIIEFWDKDSKSVYWFSEGNSEDFLKIQSDPLNLKRFFPVPRPILATCTSDKMIPTPDFEIYEQLAKQLDDVNRRMGELTHMVRLTGVHAGSINEDLSKLRSAPDGFTIPLNSWDSFKQAGGFQGVMQWIPISDVAGALQQLEGRAQTLQQRIDLITGMSDIIRGGSNPYETKGAQEIKSQWASMKISDRQRDIEHFIAELYSIMGEIIAEWFSDESLSLMCGFESFDPYDQPNIQAALQVLRDDNMRTFRITIETDATVAINEKDDKASRMEAVQAFSNLMQQAQAMIQINPQWEPLAMGVLQFGLRGYRQTRDLEGMVQQCLDSMEAAKKEAEANPPPPQPSPEEQELQMKSQIAQQELQMKSQIAQQEAQTEIQIEQMKMQNELTLKQQKLQMDAQAKAEKNQVQAQMLQQKIGIEQMKAQQEYELELRRIEASLQIAEINKGATLQVAQIEAAREAVEAQNLPEEKETPQAPAQPINITIDATRGKVKKTVKLPSGLVGEIEETPVE